MSPDRPSHLRPVPLLCVQAPGTQCWPHRPDLPTHTGTRRPQASGGPPPGTSPRAVGSRSTVCPRKHSTPVQLATHSPGSSQSLAVPTHRCHLQQRKRAPEVLPLAPPGIPSVTQRRQTLHWPGGEGTGTPVLLPREEQGRQHLQPVMPALGTEAEVTRPPSTLGHTSQIRPTGRLAGLGPGVEALVAPPRAPGTAEPQHGCCPAAGPPPPSRH